MVYRGTAWRRIAAREVELATLGCTTIPKIALYAKVYAADDGSVLDLRIVYNYAHEVNVYTVGVAPHFIL